MLTRICLHYQLMEHLAGRHAFTTFNKNTRVAFATLALKYVQLCRRQVSPSLSYSRSLSILAVEGVLPVQHGRALLQYISNVSPT
jgi:hypothetical protein